MINIDEEMKKYTQVCEEILHLHLGFLQEGVHPFGEGLLLYVESFLLESPDPTPLEILRINFMNCSLG